MTRIQMDRKLAHAASTDAGNRSMRAAGRTAWNLDDRHAAVVEYDRLYPESAEIADLWPQLKPAND